MERRKKVNELKERQRMHHSKWAKRSRAASREEVVAWDFHWSSPQDRRALYHLLMDAIRQGATGTPFEYTVLMPPIEKAHQFLSRDAKHRKWNGYEWENV